MKTVAVIFGGKTTEHDVSIVTAISSVIRPLEAAKKFKVVPIYISRSGVWYSDDKLKDITFFQVKDVELKLAKLKPIRIDINDGFKIILSGAIKNINKAHNIDIVFPAMHGTHGEDGELMGLLQLANVPFVGCDMVSSAIAMDKILAKQVVTANSDVLVSNYEYLMSKTFQANPEQITTLLLKSLTLPLFVKPAHLGSSIGITRVTEKAQLQNALEVACHYDDKVIVEEAVRNLIEVTLPIIGNDSPKPALLEEPLVSSEDFFDFDTKYMNGGKKGSKVGSQGSQGYSKIPAELPKRLYDKAVETGLAVYKAIGCSGIARVDMLIDSITNKVYFNEVNPLPGSLYAHNWSRAGMSATDLVTALVDLAEERWQYQQSKTVSFDTNFLGQF
jgi:D-alanine-D-alanine ligase